ncbi:hypothetical protein [Butyrivibrio sp. XPD2002]|uniref:hypothetical protein n=1 Tax=Butyrivibrio sp. XPD2002 TaxID=1280665 RepID=UPI0003FCF4C6|nr:hypothetical protein [Butyrivibrio sp. XPD2002]
MKNAVLSIMAIAIVILMLFCNKKVMIFSILKSQFQVYRNDNTKKTSIWDILCFVFMPIILGGIIVLGFESNIDEKLAGVLTTVFAFIFTVLFGFAAILVGKLNSDNKLEKQVVNETFVSIMTCNILSLCSAIMSIIVIIVKNKNVIAALSICIYSFSFMIVMLLLLITKRTFVIYCSNQKIKQ